MSITSPGRSDGGSPFLGVEGPVFIDVAEGRGCAPLERDELFPTTTEAALGSDYLPVPLELRERHHKELPRAFSANVRRTRFAVML